MKTTTEPNEYDKEIIKFAEDRIIDALNATRDKFPGDFKPYHFMVAHTNTMIWLHIIMRTL
jgi:hypothetical protein